ncbi:hypothetical protein BASA83_003859 [Batrachochytrium salamandrivorans]|nr:hypothetical protein BASA62_007351 [Batrachochytrium salamandrivorans]KAH9273865.1 hypothetical protein BASA83_003859 [Batrachochytrium salamandrivorans]
MPHRLLALVPEPIREQLVAVFSSTQFISFAIAFVASMGTFLGGLLVVIGVKVTNADPSSAATKRAMGVLQSFSGGVMLYITCFDLIPEGIEVLGAQETMLWMFVGVLLFGFLETMLFDHDHDDDHNTDGHTNGAVMATPDHDDNALSDQDAIVRPKGKGSPTGSSTLRKRTTTPHKPGSSSSKTGTDKPTKVAVSKQEKKDLMRTSLITFAALAMHNLPEGLGVYLSAMSDMRLGVQLAVAIMLHNIPEGMAVAIPLYAATGSPTKVLWWTLINGLAEPLGVVIGGVALHAYLTPFLLSRCLAAVGGIMLCISIHELQPTAIKYSGKVAASVSFFIGMFVCFCTLESVNVWFGGHSHGGHAHHHHADAHHDHGHHHVHHHDHGHGHTHHHGHHH